MIRRPPRSTQSRSSAASDVYKRQGCGPGLAGFLEAVAGRRRTVRRGRIITARDVEKDNGEAGGGGKGGNAAPHDARTDDTDLGDTHRGSCRGPSGLL